jgi:F-type H+-transporting ATPase subunit b
MFLIPHLGTIIWLTIIFSIVYFILKKFAWKPLLTAIDDREQSINAALESAEEAQLKLTTLQDEQQKIITLAKKEKELIIKEGVEQRDKIVAQAKESAETEAFKMIETAKKRIAREREAALVEMKSQIATMSIEIATKVVKADMADKKRHEKMVAELINDIELN